jgi:hypothetical protein
MPMLPSELPKGSAPPPLDFAHFPNRLHAYIWRNRQLVPAERLAKVVGATLGNTAHRKIDEFAATSAREGRLAAAFASHHR